LSLFALLLSASLAATAPEDKLLENYARAVIGSFSSVRQAREDRRYDVAEAEVVRIWPQRTDGIWLYQEQAILGGQGAAAGASKEMPYFQRIGHVYRLPDGRLRRDNYVLKDPARFVGLGRRSGVKEPQAADLGTAGCHNIVEPVSAGYFIARTESCRNGYKGAVTMTSLAISTPDRYVNWDRGFDGAGNRVWGPEGGGYIFERVKR
jgi:hypothetical protein